MGLNFAKVAWGRYPVPLFLIGSISYVLTKLARVCLTAAAMVLAATTFALAETTATPAPKLVAQASPAPSASPNPFTYRGYVRAYDFTRQNAYSGYGVPSGPGGKANQSSENNAIGLHADYAFQGSGFYVGGSYMYANPFNQCSNPALASSALPGPCGTKSVPPGLNPDTTLPEFEMSTLYEAYAAYNANGLYFKGGDQVITTPWATAADSRLKPIAFQGADLSYKLTRNWTIEAADYWQWECRTCSNFDHGTLLTVVNPGGYTYSGANALPTTVYDPTETPLNNNGFIYGRLGYVGPASLPLTANLYYYGFNNIASLWWLDAKMPLSTSKLRPHLAVQAGDESAPSSDLLGKVDASVFGVQAGFYPLNNVLLAAGFDSIPVRTDEITLPAGYACNANTHQITPTSSYKEATFPYFLPGGSAGTAQCTNLGGGLADIYYGGIASPYTDSYAADPLFTTGGTQGMVDRRSPGSSFKVGATFTSDDRQFVASVAQEWYDYSNPGYATSTNSTDFDIQYFFSKVPKTGLYKGFSLRVRQFSRSATNFAPPGQPIAGLFKYGRYQAEYDF
jgi:hypothetical protein